MPNDSNFWLYLYSVRANSERYLHWLSDLREYAIQGYRDSGSGYVKADEVLCIGLGLTLAFIIGWMAGGH